jgi:hypothetical protein
MPACNERFGATAAGSADLKSSAEIPPLRQAAIPLAVTRDDVVVESDRLKDRWLRQGTREAVRAGN